MPMSVSLAGDGTILPASSSRPWHSGFVPQILAYDVCACTQMWPAVWHVEGRMSEGLRRARVRVRDAAVVREDVELAAFLFQLHELSGVCGRKCGA